MTNMSVFWEKTLLEIIGPYVSCRTPTRVQAYLESTLGYYEHETMMQYFTHNPRQFAWLCVYLMVMLCALVTSLAHRFYACVWPTFYYVINLTAIVHAYVHSMGSINADARLVMKAGIVAVVAGVKFFYVGNVIGSIM